MMPQHLWAWYAVTTTARKTGIVVMANVCRVANTSLTTVPLCLRLHLRQHPYLLRSHVPLHTPLRLRKPHEPLRLHAPLPLPALLSSHMHPCLRVPPPPHARPAFACTPLPLHTGFCLHVPDTPI
jgi:hypothetical protein